MIKHLIILESCHRELASRALTLASIREVKMQVRHSLFTSHTLLHLEGRESMRNEETAALVSRLYLKCVPQRAIDPTPRTALPARMSLFPFLSSLLSSLRSLLHLPSSQTTCVYSRLLSFSRVSIHVLLKISPSNR